MKGRIFLIPVTLGSDDWSYVIPEKVLEITKNLRHFVVENTRSARRYLRMIDKKFPIDESVFFELNEHTGNKEVSGYLEPARNGQDIGVLSEAGMPGIADPGAMIIKIAHSEGIRVIPLAGPSSILMALIASGLNGQNFTFNGYLPVKPNERNARLRELEKKGRDGYAQIFMETPYRNQKMFDAIISTCQNDAMLSIAADITLPTESVRTMKVCDWKKETPDLDNRLVVFILQ